MSSAGPAQPIRKKRLTVWLQRQGTSGTDPEGGGAKERGRASVREEHWPPRQLRPGGQPPPRVPWGMVERRVSTHALRGVICRHTGSANRS